MANDGGTGPATTGLVVADESIVGSRQRGDFLRSDHPEEDALEVSASALPQLQLQPPPLQALGSPSLFP